MCNKLLGAAAALTLLATGAFAADLPSRAAPPVYAPPPIPVFSWTGLYIGGQAGYTFGKDTAYDFAGDVSGATPKGLIGGAHIGYNWSTQSLPFLGNFMGAGGVIGLEGDIDATNARSGYALPVLAVAGTERNRIQGSVRGRIGFAVDRVLFYATGGAAFGGFTNSYFAGAATDTINRTKIGYTVGGGVEYAFTNNWSLRAEYRYTDFGGYNDVLSNTAGGALVHHHDTDNRLLGGFSYKFNSFTPGAVVARY